MFHELRSDLRAFIDDLRSWRREDVYALLGMVGCGVLILYGVGIVE
jgi:hypothetical protein